MGIQDVGYGGFGAFRSDYRINNIPKVDETTQVNKPVEQPSKVEKIEAPKIEEVDLRPRATDPNSVSLTFDKNTDFSYIGSDKDINGLDMEKAISDMQQDGILKEYQYFVGSASNVFSSEDGVVIAKMN